MRDITRETRFNPDGFDDQRLARFDMGLLPRVKENEKSIITNIDVASLLLMLREPREIKELAAAIAAWRQRDNVTESSYLQELRIRFDVKNGMASLTPATREQGYIALRKMELVGWLMPVARKP